MLRIVCFGKTAKRQENDATTVMRSRFSLRPFLAMLA
jgi:hypothetical protein